VIHATAAIQAAKLGVASSNTGVAVSCQPQAPTGSEQHSFTSPWAGNDDSTASRTISFDMGVSLTSAGLVVVTCTNN